jgi:hypothetical protein
VWSKEDIEVPGEEENGEVGCYHPHLYNMPYFPLWLFFLDCWTIKNKALESFKMSGNIYTSTQRHNPEDYIHQQH